MRHKIRHRTAGTCGPARPRLALLAALCVPAMSHAQVVTLPDAEYLVAGGSGLAPPPETCELSSPDPNVPRQRVCAGSTAQIQIALLSAARGNGQPTALADIGVATQALFIGTDSLSSSQVTVFAHAALTPLARAYFAANPEFAIPRIPVRIPWAGQWQMSVENATAVISTQMRTVIPFSRPSTSVASIACRTCRAVRPAPTRPAAAWRARHRSRWPTTA